MMEGPNERKESDKPEDPAELSEITTDPSLNQSAEPIVKRKPFKGRGDSLNSMAAEDRARHDPAKNSLASRIANLRKT